MLLGIRKAASFVAHLSHTCSHRVPADLESRNYAPTKVKRVQDGAMGEARDVLMPTRRKAISAGELDAAIEAVGAVMRRGFKR